MFGLIAVLFNPLVPIYLGRATWFNIDIGVTFPNCWIAFPAGAKLPIYRGLERNWNAHQRAS
jgi:hypothetical protein